MKYEHAYLIKNALEAQINEMLHCADVREAEGNEESRVLFLEEANRLKKALWAFEEENPAR